MKARNKIVEGDLFTIIEESLDWESFQGKKVLVTGASGFIGGYIVDVFALLNEQRYKKPVTIYALARNEKKLINRFSYLLSNDWFVPIIQDVTDPVDTITKIDLIIHAASDASPKRYLKNPVETIKANTVGVINLLELAEKNEAKLLFLSSGAIYGNNNEIEISETDYGIIDPLHSHACYSESKRLGEAVCMAHFRQKNTPISIARISHTYGPTLSLDDGRVFTDFIADALEERDIQVRGDGRDLRPFCYITDLITGLFYILTSGGSGEVYNVGAEDELEISELARLVRIISEKEYLRIVIAQQSETSNIRVQGHFNTGKLKNLGWRAIVSPESGFKRMFQYYAEKNN